MVNRIITGLGGAAVIGGLATMYAAPTDHAAVNRINAIVEAHQDAQTYLVGKRELVPAGFNEETGQHEGRWAYHQANPRAAVSTIERMLTEDKATNTTYLPALQTHFFSQHPELLVSRETLDQVNSYLGSIADNIRAATSDNRDEVYANSATHLEWNIDDLNEVKASVNYAPQEYLGAGIAGLGSLVTVAGLMLPGASTPRRRRSSLPTSRQLTTRDLETN